MREDLIVMLFGFIIGLFIVILGIKTIEKDEQIKILEQSLTEQIQEKEVYMKMLEQY